MVATPPQPNGHGRDSFVSLARVSAKRRPAYTAHIDWMTPRTIGAP